MPTGIIIAIVVVLVIVTIATGAGIYYKNKAADDAPAAPSNVDATGAEVATGITSSVDGPVATVDRTSGVTGTTSAALASAAADSGAIAATPTASAAAPAPAPASAVVTAQTAPVSVTVSAPVITQPAAPAATSISGTAVTAPAVAAPPPKIAPPPVDTGLNDLRDQATAIAKILNIVMSNASLGEKQKASAETPRIIDRANVAAGRALDKNEARMLMQRINATQQRISAEMQRQTSIQVQAPKTAPAPVATISSVFAPKPPAPPAPAAQQTNIFGVQTAPKQPSTTAPQTNIFGVQTAPKQPAPQTNIFGIQTTPKQPAQQTNIFGVQKAPAAQTSVLTGTVAQPSRVPVWDPKIPRLSVILTEIDQVHNVVVKSNANFDTKVKTSKGLPSVEILSASVNQEIKNADPKTDAARSFGVTRDVYRRKIDEVVAVIKAGPPAASKPITVAAPAPAPVAVAAPAPTPVAVALPAQMPKVSAPVSAGATQFNVLKAQIDVALKTALDPKASDSQKIAEAKKLPSVVVFKQAADRAAAEAKTTPGVVTANLIAGVQKDPADYLRKLNQALTIIDSLKISPCGNSRDSAALLGCKVTPYVNAPLGQCTKDRTGVPCTPGTGCNGKICIQGTAPGVLKYVNPSGLLAFFK